MRAVTTPRRRRTAASRWPAGRGRGL